MFIVFTKRLLFLILIIIILIAACIFHIGSIPASVAVKNNEDTVYVPIIMYHEIKTFKLGKDVISPAEFESDLKYLKENNYNTITLTELIDYVNEDGALPENPIILTFDDGYLSTYKYAFPLIKEYDMKIVFSIIGKNTDDFTQIPDDNIDYSHVTWDQVNEMIQSGKVEIQNHTYNLHYDSAGPRYGVLPNSSESSDEYEQALKEDIYKLQMEIIAHTGRLPNTFTYPYGKLNDSSETVIKGLKFQASLSCDYGINIITKDPECLYKLKRVIRSHGDTMENVLNKAYKTVKTK